MARRAKLDVSRTVKCAVSLVVFAASQVGRLLARLVGKPLRASCVVLYYHSVPAEQRVQFARQLDVILRHTCPIGITGPVALQPGVDYVGITFDDAFQNFADEALPELAKRKISSTMFVISGALGKGFGPADHSEKVMSAEQLCALPADLVTIGSHTTSHPFMPGISEEEARRELRESKADLEKLLHREIPAFSFPFGGFSPRLVDICREIGYRRVFTTRPGWAFASSPDEFAVGRIRVDPTDWPVEFRLKLAGAYRWLPLAFSLKRKILGDPSVTRTVTKPVAERSMVREWRGP